MTKKIAKNILTGLLNQTLKPVDNIPAKLTENEFVIPADVVHIAGKGDVKKGEDFFTSMISKMRRRAKKKIKSIIKP